ncbi:MAG: hypothetical protein LBQ89_02750 [Treponema sp.]|nr:hypothetical protein [Treponema sp.]
MKLPLDQFLLLCQGQPPYIGKKNVYYEDPLFKVCFKISAAFATREEALKAAASTVAKLNKRRWFDRGETRRSVEMTDFEVIRMQNEPHYWLTGFRRSIMTTDHEFIRQLK